MILVDDGSIDNSRNICFEYANSDRRFQCFYQENSGPSAARNMGIQVAKGEYIQLLDSNDYLIVDALAHLVSSIKDAELVIAPYFIQYNDKSNKK